MAGPTIDEIRDVKAAIVRQFQDNPAFASAGIGERNGRLIVRVNWRTLPSDLQLPKRIGEVEISHHEVGTIRHQAE
jgi:hypothetical protein